MRERAAKRLKRRYYGHTYRAHYTAHLPAFSLWRFHLVHIRKNMEHVAVRRARHQLTSEVIIS